MRRQERGHSLRQVVIFLQFYRIGFVILYFMTCLEIANMVVLCLCLCLCLVGLCLVRQCRVTHYDPIYLVNVINSNVHTTCMMICLCEEKCYFLE